MNAQSLFEKDLTLSRVGEISRLHRCHEAPRNVSFSCNWAKGEGVQFQPFDGVQFGVCGPLTVTREKLSSLRCETSVIVCIVVVSGETHLDFGSGSLKPLSISSSMFAIGELADTNVLLRLPAQDNYMHAAMFISKKFLKSIFGENAYENMQSALHGVQRRDLPSMAVGIASSDCMQCVKHFVENKKYFSGNELYAKYSILEFFFKVMRSAENRVSSPSANFMDDELHRLKHLKKEIEHNFLSIHSAGELYPQIGMNRSKANQGFKYLYGLSVAQFIHKRKMEYAHSMLHQRKMNVTQCAFAVGYSNVGHFIRAYKKLYGVTPKQTMQQLFQQ